MAIEIPMDDKATTDMYISVADPASLTRDLGTRMFFHYFLFLFIFY